MSITSLVEVDDDKTNKRRTAIKTFFPLPRRAVEDRGQEVYPLVEPIGIWMLDKEKETPIHLPPPARSHFTNRLLMLSDLL
jgi:hypothetical protein